jgi:hypothetical protein
MPEDVLAPCGLYCAVCLDSIVNHACHGCGCDCGACAGAWHDEHCEIARCAHGRGYGTCAECDELPCTTLIQFAYHPFCIHHLPVIETLRRVRKVGRERVLAELRAYFADEERRLEWAFIEAHGDRRREAFRAWRERR